MDKTAHPDHPIHDLLSKRWSPRAFADRPVEPAKLASILEAARWAPSAYNDQPWRFIVATREQPAEHARLLKCLIEFNRSWAAPAPVLILSVARMKFAHNGQGNVHAWHDVGLATQNMLVQATALGLYAHAMAGFDADVARQTYTIPADHQPVAALALGYMGEAATLPDELRKREETPRERRPLSEIVFTGSWGQRYPGV
ncbi:MAG: nitroreductase family protein [Phycisphaerae bacterium]